ncbi:HEPN domain-containing protein [Desulfonatronum thiodismutans]|uniref:HEPN domain-containing protein n=1 Tax=Desulfonatronum thiodismutans TaxID=159290 RepID=UPI0004ABD322|nr:HEPN domain-containing protein [Desulfonatronum thiodismutans]
MEVKEKVEYWVNSAKHDLDVAESLYKSGKYDWSLFIAHLVLEKLFKALFVKRKEAFPPRIHDLVRLAAMADESFDEETLDFLDGVNTFNISTRYPDEKLNFYRICTKEFAAANLKRIKEVQECLLKKIYS